MASKRDASAADAPAPRRSSRSSTAAQSSKPISNGSTKTASMSKKIKTDDKPDNGETVADTVKTVVDTTAETAAIVAGAAAVNEAVDTPAAPIGAELKVGDVLPADVVLKNENGEEVNVGSLTSSKGAVVFVYPKANTGGCTTQACGFRDSYSEFEGTGYDVYGLSMDAPSAQLSWKTKNSYQYHFLCDPQQLLLKPLGAAKGLKGVSRSHFVIEKGGKLLLKKIGVKPADSPKDALAFIKTLS